MISYAFMTTVLIISVYPKRRLTDADRDKEDYIFVCLIFFFCSNKSYCELCIRNERYTTTGPT